jgi:hypothetical protein
MQSPRCKHFTYKLGKTGREKTEPTTASNIRGHATPSMPQTMPIPRQLSQDKKVCASEDGNETPQEETARKQTPEQTTARPRMNSPLFIHPCCAVDQKNSMPEEPAKPMLRKCARFKRCHQSIDTRVIASVWFTQIVPCSETPRGAAEGLGTHAANTPTRLAHAGLALGAASTGR